MADIPHLAFPLRFSSIGGKTVAAVTEQGSADEIFDAVSAIVRFRRGDRIDLLDFGITEQLFREGGFDLDLLVAEVLEWEPRAQIDISNIPDRYEELFESIRMDIRSREEG
jgi:hypothetical protein